MIDLQMEISKNDFYFIRNAKDYRRKKIVGYTLAMVCKIYIDIEKIKNINLIKNYNKYLLKISIEI